MVYNFSRSRRIWKRSVYKIPRTIKPLIYSSISSNFYFRSKMLEKYSNAEFCFRNKPSSMRFLINAVHRSAFHLLFGWECFQLVQYILIGLVYILENPRKMVYEKKKSELFYFFNFFLFKGDLSYLYFILSVVCGLKRTWNLLFAKSFLRYSYLIQLVFTACCLERHHRNLLNG